jgi:hypothetical protein
MNCRRYLWSKCGEWGIEWFILGHAIIFFVYAQYNINIIIIDTIKNITLKTKLCLNYSLMSPFGFSKISLILQFLEK